MLGLLFPGFSVQVFTLLWLGVLDLLAAPSGFPQETLNSVHVVLYSLM